MTVELKHKRAALELRARVMGRTREFFVSRGYVEVETPLRVRVPALEDHIDAEASGDHWLRTSPELHMKRMLCAGYQRIFQIGPCFRRGERGERHLPEYTMLEWYRVGAGSADLIPETLELLTSVAMVTGKTVFDGVDFSVSPRLLTVQEAFQKWAGWDPVAAFDADRFDLDLVDKVEPRIALEAGPVILKDFPAARASLARLHPEDPRVADRWELYAGGVELANAYSELTDAAEQRERFLQCAEGRKNRGQEVYPLDEAFLNALHSGMPACAGIALGMDRLLMRLLGIADIRDTVAFAEG